VSDESEAVVLGMWADYDREGLPGILRWAADVGLPGRANEAYRAMHGTEDVA
jgi:hypothetical protein